MRPIRSPLPFVLMLAVLPTEAFAQSLVCHAIRRGESVTQAARRVTGNSRNAYEAWFQIMNPSSRFIPKSQYNRVRAGWQACVITLATPDTSSDAQHVTTPDEPQAPDASEALEASVPAAAPVSLASANVVEVAGDRPPSAASDVLRTIGGMDFTMVWIGVAMVVPWFGWRVLDDYLTRRKTTTIVVQHFAHRFVLEFERPLVLNRGAERPVRAQIRTGARQGRFDILLAPGQGRRYPNLSDHRKNVEYDVARVMHALADDAFVSGPLYTRAEWVVVPFQFKAGPRQSGATCISSL